MVNPLVALSCRRKLLDGVAEAQLGYSGMTETSTMVSTTKVRPDFLLTTSSRLGHVGPVTFTNTTRPLVCSPGTRSWGWGGGNTGGLLPKNV